MTLQKDERPLDTPIIVLSPEESLRSEIFAHLTASGWGPSVIIADPDQNSTDFIPAGFEPCDVMILSHSHDQAEHGDRLRRLFTEGLTAAQIVLATSPRSFEQRALAKSLGIDVLPVEIKKTATGPVIDLGDVVQIVSDRIFSRLAALMDDEVRSAKHNGCLGLLKNLTNHHGADPIERATIAALLTAKVSHRLSFRRRAIRAALFTSVMALSSHDDLLKEAQHLWEVSSVLREVALGLTTAGSGVAISGTLRLESWCVIAADIILGDANHALDLITRIIQKENLEARAAVLEAVRHASVHVQRWKHAPAS